MSLRTWWEQKKRVLAADWNSGPSVPWYIYLFNPLTGALTLMAFVFWLMP